MKKRLYLFLPLFLMIYSCSHEASNNSVEKWKNEILETERNFSIMAGEEGISKSFTTYAADDAVLMRNEKLIIGKGKITELYQNKPPGISNAQLSWKPDFVDVAASGDLGYTYGKYLFSYIDSSGMKKEDTGIFHTVWKRQSDGTWRFVWD